MLHLKKIKQQKKYCLSDLGKKKIFDENKLFWSRRSAPPSVCFSLPSEADQRSHNEGEHENWEPPRQHEEEPRASDHSV